jgi:hypothetical protein
MAKLFLWGQTPALLKYNAGLVYVSGKWYFLDKKIGIHCWIPTFFYLVF